MSKQYKYLDYDGLNALVTNIKDKFTEVDNKFSQYALKTTPPNNEIWYTSTDGNIATPNDSDVFGANIVSNTYSDGKGVIRFDGDVTSIGNSAFSECDDLTSIIIPDSVTSIGNSAFENCIKLTNVTIPNSVTSIGNSAFAFCSLSSITIPVGVTSIGSYAFENCIKLTNVTIPNSVTSISDNIFLDCSSLTSIIIPDSVTSIGSYAFENCIKLTNVTIPNSVTSISDNIFFDCSSLTSVNIPDSVTSIGDWAFESCSSLTSVNISDSVTSIGAGAFRACDHLINITIPNSATSIGDVAFEHCSSLTSVYCKPTTPPTLLGSDTFSSNASSRKIYVPVESVDAYKTASVWSEYADDIVGCVFEDEALVSGGNIKTINGESILGSGDINVSTISITWEDLVSLRDNSKLAPGQQYRIIDYMTTTSQANTMSAEHQFDIIVTANDKGTLNNIARACLHEGDTYFSENGAKLETWQIWYCLDNDTERFAWANTTDGKGVIYRMIDEWNNDCPYDFKNIKFRNQLDSSDLNYYYTFNYSNPDGHEDMTVKINSFYNEAWEWKQHTVYNNTIRPYFSPSAWHTYQQSLNSIIFDRKNIYDSDYDDYYTESDEQIENFYKNEFSIDCHSMIFRNACHDNKFGKGCYGNTFGELCYSNTFGDNCSHNTFGDWCYSNTFGNYCNFTTFNYYCSSNKFGNNCYNNTFDSNCNSNTFGDYCSSNEFGTECEHNTFGNLCRNNKFGYNCNYNKFGNSCSSNIFVDECNYNKFGDRCERNKFGDRCSSNTFGNNCRNINFVENDKYPSYKDVKIEDNCHDIKFTYDVGDDVYAGTYSSFKVTRNFTGGIHLPHNLTTPNEGVEYTISKNTKGDVKIYCEADLIA